MNQELKLKWHSIYGQILFDRKLMTAWKQVENNDGRGGIDRETIESFKANEENRIKIKKKRNKYITRLKEKGQEYYTPDRLNKISNAMKFVTT